MWACLAAMAIHSQELQTAEIAFSAIDEVRVLDLLSLNQNFSVFFNSLFFFPNVVLLWAQVDKVEFLQRVMEIPTVEGRNAELALFQHRVDDAEAILLQAKMIYRAIKLNIRLFRWDRCAVLSCCLLFFATRSALIPALLVVCMTCVMVTQGFGSCIEVQSPLGCGCWLPPTVPTDA